MSDDEVEIRCMVRKFFNNDEAKVEKWMTTTNPYFCAGATPAQMIRGGRSAKLLLLMSDAIERVTP